MLANLDPTLTVCNLVCGIEHHNIRYAGSCTRVQSPTSWAKQVIDADALALTDTESGYLPIMTVERIAVRGGDMTRTIASRQHVFTTARSLGAVGDSFLEVPACSPISGVGP